MPTGDLVHRSGAAAAVEPDEFVPAELVRAEEPGTKQLILRGRAALVDLGHDPDDWVDAEAEADVRAARSKNTVAALLWAYGALVTYCAATGRRHDPPTSATMRNWVRAHWDMTRTKDDGTTVKRGRLEQPYSPASVTMRVYLIAMICNRLGWHNPTRDKTVHEQLTAYRIKFEDAGFKSFEPDPMTEQLSVDLVRRACDLGTINGLRNATAFRMQFDTGCRAGEMVGDGALITGLRIDQVKWLSDTKVELTFVQTKGRKPRKVYMQGLPTLVHPDDVDLPPAEQRRIPNPNWDVDPVRLLGLWMEALRSAGITDGPLFREVSHASGRRKDFAETGIYAGKILRQQWSRHSYQMCWDRAVEKSGIALLPRGGRLRLTTHSNRAGLITAAFDAGMPLELVAFRTGHSRNSKAITRYLHTDRRWGSDNPGVLVREASASAAAARLAESKRRRTRNSGSKKEGLGG